MIGDYLVAALVFGIAVSFVTVIHRLWLRDAFKEEAQQSEPAKDEGACGKTTPRPSPHRKSRGLSLRACPAGFSHGINETKL